MTDDQAPVAAPIQSRGRVAMPPKPADSRRVARRRGKAEIARVARADAALKLEAADEAIAPRAQRATRLVRDGNTFRVASPLVRLYKSGTKRTAAGDEPTINAGHVWAAERLHRAWDESQTISFGVSSYGEAVRGTPQSGVLSQTTINAVNRQHVAASEVNMIRRTLGPLWGIVEAVALKGQDIKTWNETARMDSMAASGYLRAGLDMLIGFYRVSDAGGRKPLVAADGLGKGKPPQTAPARTS